MKGFAITINNIRNWVTFKEFNGKVVVCRLEDDLGEVFEAKAFCNSEAGDVFDRTTGEALALKRAAKLRYVQDKNKLNKAYNIAMKEITKDYEDLLFKWGTENTKQKRKKRVNDAV